MRNAGGQAAGRQGRDMKTEIIHEDKDILVVYKPAGLATQTARAGQQDVVSELKNYLWQKGMVTGAALGRSTPYLGIIHRLDQPVEGLLVFARNARTGASLTEQLQKQGQEGMLHKYYYGVLFGQPAEKEGELVDYLYKNKENKAIIVDPPDGVKTSVKTFGEYGEYGGCGESGEPTEAGAPADLKKNRKKNGFTENFGQEQGAKKAVLQYRVLETVDRAGILSLADIHIRTGRFHQIRAQMAHRGTPLLGDIKYGNDSAKAAAKTLYLQGTALCAYRLELRHPSTGENMCFRIKPRGKAFSFFSGEIFQ